MVVYGIKDWYLVQFDETIRVRDYVKDKVIIQSRHAYNNMAEDPNVVVYFMMIPHASVLKQKTIETSDLRFAGYAIVNRLKNGD